MKKMLTGFIVGVAVTISTSVFADTELKKIEAYLNPALPITLDGGRLNLQNSPIIYEGSTFLPLRETATILGKDVQWNDSTKTVELKSKSKEGSVSMPTGTGVRNGNKATYYNVQDVLVLGKDKSNGVFQNWIFYTKQDFSSTWELMYINKKFPVAESDRIVQDNVEYLTEDVLSQFLDQSFFSELKRYELNNEGKLIAT